ncbi:hypothetical protein GCM10018779_66740 [Streptomyces griseocarneus]|nr:hypothetical protein GCM10018779_66740 [Streptomyces griseocarneus]
MQVVSAQLREFVEVFTGLRPRQVQRLVKAVHRAGGQALDPGRPGCPWSLSLEDRVLLAAMYCRTNLSMLQLAPLFEISTAAVGRIIKRHGPLLTLAPAKRRPGSNDVLIVDGTLVPTRDRSVAASSKNHRYSTNTQVLIKADTKLVLVVGRPLPGNPTTAPPSPTSASRQPAGTRPSSPTADTAAPDCSSRTAGRPGRNGCRSGRNSTTPPTAGCGHASSTASRA